MQCKYKYTYPSDANEVIGELFESLHSRHQEHLFDSIQLMYYKFHKLNFIQGSSYTDFPDQIKKKKATINPKNTDDKCFQYAFQYAATVALNYDKTKWDPERVSNIKPFINKYKCKGINYPSKIDDWKTLEKNNITIALNILYIKET